MWGWMGFVRSTVVVLERALAIVLLVPAVPGHFRGGETFYMGDVITIHSTSCFVFCFFLFGAFKTFTVVALMWCKGQFLKNVLDR